MANFPNTGSRIGRGIETPTEQGRTSSGLSTQIVIKVNGVAVGALQDFTLDQSRPLEEIKEIGTDGIIEIVPNGATTFKVRLTRLVFDNLRLPEALSRSFRFINAQRIPFDIEVFDISNAKDPGVSIDSNDSSIVVMKIVNCWFSSLSTPYRSSAYTIIETANVQAETAYVSSGNTIPGLRSEIGSEGQTDAFGIEANVNAGQRRGAVDAAGIINAVFNTYE